MTNLSKSTLFGMLLVLLSVASVWAQSAPTVQWRVDLGQPPTVAKVVNAPGGEYFVLLTPRFGSSTLARLTADGQYQPIRTLPNSPDTYEANQLIRTQDGGFLISGNVNRDGFNDRGFITKLDVHGNTVWNTVPDPLPLVPGIRPTSYRNTFLLERSNYYVKFTNIGRGIVSSAFRQHFDKNGRELTFRRTPVDNTLAYAASTEFVSDLAEAVDGGILVGFGNGFTNLRKITDTDTSFALPGYPDPYPNNWTRAITPTVARDGYYVASSQKISKINPSGYEVWSVNQADIGISNPYKLLAEPNGVTFVAFSAGRVVLQKLSLSGTPLWQVDVTDGGPSDLLKASDGGYIVATNTPRFIKFSPEQTTSNFALTSPNYDCNTGQLTLNTTGGNGSPIEFRIVGLRDWASSNSFSVPAHQRNGTTFNLEARQNGQMISVGFTTACGTTTPPPSTTTTPPVNPPANSFAVRIAGYDCTTGQLNTVANNANGSVEFRILGLRDWASSSTFTVPAWQRTNTTFKIEARTSLGAYASTDFTTTCGSIQPPVTPPAGTALRFETPAFYCETGLLRLITSGGDGTLVEYRIPGLRDWGPTDFTVPTYQRQNTTFTLYARQSGSEVSTTFTANCPTNARLAHTETSRSWQMTLLGNPVEDQVQVRLTGTRGQTVVLRMSDATGRIVTERAVQMQTEEQIETLRMSGSAGVYVLGAVSNGQQQSLKVLKK
ncbi:T9SS type A sorting domain-containing protein [Rudanella paleaurantiibacter]|uniref:T9SS type A sorting domain-containing protein n=1 Tax=Rudanella paleaurantiibacter TaxID=2614655 RepID=A0A7J5TZR1_9BACT|nr:T9SS type A sorting domain-containing protein [Rudanella paleaurantiibacter]KAB7730978.1 T9SS type A sorting domain-containing protein [Rudanella paleaurantiibacter]